jgi:ubiquinone/menaquinone biosynthesis C-methylase UbiE
MPECPDGLALKTDLFEEAFGEGLYPSMTRTTKEVIGMDCSLEIVGMANEHHGDIIALAGDVRNLPFGNNAFDIIVSNSTLDHFSTRTELIDSIRELARVLKPGGYLIITLDNPGNPLVGIRNLIPYNWIQSSRIVPYYIGVTCGISRLIRHLNDSGLVVTEKASIMHCPRLAAVALSRYTDSLGTRWQQRLLKFLGIFEILKRFPSRFITGYFVCALAKKPDSGMQA